MVPVKILGNEVQDAETARRFEREIEEAVEAAAVADVVVCAILDEGRHAEIEVEQPGWIERVQIPYPAPPGEVRRVMSRLLRDLGLADAAPALAWPDLSRGY